MKTKLVWVVLLVLVVCVGALGANAYFTQQELIGIKQNLSESKTVKAFPVSTYQAEDSSPLASINYKNYIDQALASVSAQLSATKKPLATATPVGVAALPPSQKITSYITLNGNSFSTKNTDWVDVPGAEVWVDVANDYGSGATLTWDAFIREEHGNGYAYARLYDATHNIEVPGSVIYTNNQASTMVVSSSLSMWAGRNLYKVQMKSQKSFNVYFDSGRIRVTY